MSTLWANGDRGLKSSSVKTISSEQYSLTSRKNFTKPNHPLHEKIRYVSTFFYNFASFQVNKCPLYGQMETWGLKSTSVATKRQKGLFNLTQRTLPQPNHPLQEKIR